MYLTQTLHRAARVHPEKIATICGERRTSYASLQDRVSRLAGALRMLGVAPGDRVGMLSLNSDRYLEYFFGVYWAGGVVNPPILAGVRPNLPIPLPIVIRAYCLSMTSSCLCSPRYASRRPASVRSFTAATMRRRKAC